MKNLILRTCLALVCLAAFSTGTKAQFKEEAFSQSYNDPSDTTGAARDSVDKMWSFREFFRGVSHKDTTLRIGTMFAGSTVFIGAEQIYNRQYWKLPVIYGGLGATIGMGIHYNSKYRHSKKGYDIAMKLDPDMEFDLDTHSRDMATYMFASAGFIYWATLMDGVVNYKKDVRNQPGKATLYSILLPGLGQAYNGEYWKIPIYWGMMIGSYHYFALNSRNYKRYKRIHNEATDPSGNYTGKIPADRALYFRNVYRRYRDYSVVAMVGTYLLQVIDANVFAYMQDFEVDDDLSLKVTPTIISPYNEYISPDNEYAFAPVTRTCPPGSFGAGAFGDNAIGIKVGLRF